MANNKILYTHLLEEPHTLPPPLQSVVLRGPNEIILPPIKHHFVGAFGTRYGMTANQIAYQDALQKNLRSYMVRVAIREHRGTSATRVSLKNLCDTEFLSIERLTKDLNGAIKEVLHVPEKERLKDYLEKTPSVIPKIWEAPEFQHIGLLSWRVTVKQSVILQYAIVKSEEWIESVEITHYKGEQGEWKPHVERLFK
ncbi:hypothetical protein [Thiolapillus sp.]|uniref:hypothetical protein n=2 Tax=Thiolapillus sp. TaxID=2017437 RepID=UPI003AF56B12